MLLLLHRMWPPALLGRLVLLLLPSPLSLLLLFLHLHRLVAAAQ
jgi:hypothetical protein